MFNTRVLKLGKNLLKLTNGYFTCILDLAYNKPWAKYTYINTLPRWFSYFWFHPKLPAVNRLKILIRFVRKQLQSPITFTQDS